MTKRKSPQEELQQIRDTEHPKSKWRIFVKIANPDDTGVSEWLHLDELPSVLHFGNGRDWIRDNAPIHNCFNVQYKRGKRGKIIALKLDGFLKEDDLLTISNYIPKKIKDYFNGGKCVVSGASHKPMEVDHKIGAKRFQDPNDPRLKDKYYYQSMSKSLNDAKRQHCKKCQLTKRRFDARTLGFNMSYTAGSEILEVEDDKKFSFPDNPCYGCYWYDPVEFRKALTLNK